MTRVPTIGSACGRCHYCSRDVYSAGSVEARANPNVLATRDHIFPTPVRGRAGAKAHQTITACRECNHLRGDAPYEVFAWFMRQHDDEQIRKRTALGQEWRHLRFDLVIAGFKAASALAMAGNKPAPAPTAAGTGMIKTCPGKFTMRDLRRRHADNVTIFRAPSAEKRA